MAYRFEKVIVKILKLLNLRIKFRLRMTTQHLITSHNSKVKMFETKTNLVMV